MSQYNNGNNEKPMTSIIIVCVSYCGGDLLL